MRVEIDRAITQFCGPYISRNISFRSLGFITIPFARLIFPIGILGFIANEISNFYMGEFYITVG